MILALALLASLSLPDTLPGRFVDGVHAGESGSRPYRLYLPANPAAARGAPLVVMLHGCTQTAGDLAAGTRMNRLAEERGFLVLYPEQPAGAHPLRCWSWYEPAHQRRGAGEPALLADMVRRVAREREADGARVFVAGISAGGAMALVLAAGYPELFAAAGSFAGVAPGAAAGAADGLRLMREGPGAPPGSLSAGLPRLILFHGAADAVVHPSNLAAVRDQWAAATAPGLLPVVDTARAGGLSAERWTYRRADGRVLLSAWLLDGVGHAWSGGSAEGTFSDPRGPDASRELVDFFLGRHP